MIKNVLDAYEARTRDKNKFWKRIARKDRTTKIILISTCSIFLIGLFLFLLFPSSLTLIGMIIVAVAMQCVTLFLEKSYHKQWEVNLEEYYDDLNILAGILKDENFKLYEKNKIKQLIRKYHQSIKSEEGKRERKNNSIEKFILTYIVPVITFFGGKISVSDFADVEWIGIGGVIIICICMGKYFCSSIIQLIELISWNQLEKEKYIVLKLQDLLDRNFPIEKDDLI